MTTLRTTPTPDGDGRRMRIIPWEDSVGGAPCYTLVKEWFENGVVVRDEFTTMDAAEAQALHVSLDEALGPSRAPSTDLYRVRDRGKTADQLLALGYTADRVSLYDEEGVEGWAWTTPSGEEMGSLVALHNEPPPAPDDLWDIL